MSPYAETAEMEGELVEVGIIDGNFGVRIEAGNGPITVTGMDELDVAGLVPGICGRVRITIEPIDDQ